MAFEKGHEKLGGRKSHTPNKVTQSIRGLLNAELPEDELRKLWRKYLYNKDLAIAFEAFKLANQYMFGRPALAWRDSDYGADAHCNTGGTESQSRGVDGEGDRRAIPQVIAVHPNGGKDETDGRCGRGACSHQHNRGTEPANGKREETRSYADN
jgi:hypothetical protein